MKLWHMLLVACATAALASTCVHEQRKYLADRAACEAKGRFYWRGNCLPSECSVVNP